MVTQEKGLVKVSVDGAYKEGKAGVGVVIRDYEGDVLASMAYPIYGMVEAS